jgi:hypothetical protein
VPQLVLTGGLSLAKTTLDITLIGVSTNVPDIGLQVNATFVLNSYVLCGAAVLGMPRWYPICSIA